MIRIYWKWKPALLLEMRILKRQIFFNLQPFGGPYYRMMFIVGEYVKAVWEMNAMWGKVKNKGCAGISLLGAPDLKFPSDGRIAMKNIHTFTTNALWRDMGFNTGIFWSWNWCLRFYSTNPLVQGEIKNSYPPGLLFQTWDSLTSLKSRKNIQFLPGGLVFRTFTSWKKFVDRKWVLTRETWDPSRIRDRFGVRCLQGMTLLLRHSGGQVKYSRLFVKFTENLLLLKKKNTPNIVLIFITFI